MRSTWALLGILALTFCLQATAQGTAGAWPTRAVRVVVPYAPGSTPDAIARMVFERVQKSTGQVVVIENRPGAAGMIGTDLVAKAAADGHTLVIAPAGPLATNALLYRRMPYDPVKDLAPVALVAETPTVLVTSTSVPAGNAQQLLRLMADPKNRMTYASPGAGTLGHLNMAYLVSRADAADIPHVPFPGSPQILTAMIANDVQMAALPPLAVVQQIKAGRIKAIATIGPRRSAVLPELATLKEQGVDFEPVGWFGIATTAGTPPEVLDAIHRQIAVAMRNPEVEAAFRMQGLDLADLGPKAFAAYIADEIGRWKPVIQRYGISLD